jgi:hypothetical protein
MLRRRSLLALLVCGCSTHAPSSTAIAPATTRELLAYDGVVHIEPDSSLLRATWSITIPARAIRGDSLVFDLNKQLRIGAVRGDDVARVDVQPQGDVTLIVLRFHNRAADRPVQLHFEYGGQFRSTGDSINSIGPQWVELALDSFWQPVVRGLGEQITSRLVIELPPGWRVATGGTLEQDGGRFIARSVTPLLDVPFAASPSFQVRESGGNQVYSVDSPDSTVVRTLATATACANYLNSVFGAAPLPPLRIVLAPRSGPGYARKNYIVINPRSSNDAVGFARFLCHEESHFWASGALSSGPDNWLNEGIAEFLAGRAVRALQGAAAYQTIVTAWRERAAGQPAVWTDTSTTRPSRAVAYFKAPYLLDQLETTIGPSGMDSVLVGFLLAPIHTTPAFLARLHAVRGAAVEQSFREQLGR